MNDSFSPHRFSLVDNDLLVGNDRSRTSSDVESLEEGLVFGRHGVVLYKQHQSCQNYISSLAEGNLTFDARDGDLAEEVHFFRVLFIDDGLNCSVNIQPSDSVC